MARVFARAARLLRPGQPRLRRAQRVLLRQRHHPRSHTRQRPRLRSLQSVPRLDHRLHRHPLRRAARQYPCGRERALGNGACHREGRRARSAASRPVTPFPATSSPTNGFAETLTEGALAKAPSVTPAKQPDPESMRKAVVTALAAQGHATASQLLGTGSWKIDGASLRIEVPGMGKKMLALTVNAAAEKIIRQELQSLGAPTRFLVVPGEGSAAAPAAAATPAAGSVEEAALAHPWCSVLKRSFMRKSAALWIFASK